MEIQTILVQVTGRDRPGITAGLLGLLDDAGAAVGDIEQITIRGRLTLGLLVEVPEGRDLLKELLVFAYDHDLQVEFEPVDATPTPTTPGHVVTVLGERLGPRELAAATRAIADAGANIDRILRLSRYPAWSYEFVVHGGDDATLRTALLEAAAANPGLDVAVQREGLGRRAKRLVVVDMDSTLIADEVIDLLADEAGCADEVAAITDAAMAGDLDFEAALRARVARLKGLDIGVFDRVLARITYTPGARTFIRTLRRLGFTTAIVSGGFTPITEAIRAELGVDAAFANQLEIVDGHLTGELLGPVVDRRRKAELLADIAADAGVPLEQTVAIGDGANDLDMLNLAGLGIAFCARPAVREAADTSVSVPYLDAILFLLGVTREEIEYADAADGSTS